MKKQPKEVNHSATTPVPSDLSAHRKPAALSKKYRDPAWFSIYFDASETPRFGSESGSVFDHEFDSLSTQTSGSEFLGSHLKDTSNSGGRRVAVEGGREKDSGRPGVASVEESLSEADTYPVFNALVETRLIIRDLLRVNRFAKGDKSELEWDLWLIEGLLFKNFTFGELARTMDSRIAQ